MYQGDHMKKLVSFIIVGAFVLTGLASGLTAGGRDSSQLKADYTTFSSLQIQDASGVVHLALPEATAYSKTPGEPIVPIVTRVMVLPFPVVVDSVSVSFSGARSSLLAGSLEVAGPVSVDMTSSAAPSVQALTSSDGPSFTYHSGAGRGEKGIETFLSVHLFPVWYDVSGHVISCAESASITVSYRVLPPKSAPTEDYQLVVVTHPKFVSALSPLVAHKIAKGLSTKVVTMEQICNGTFFPEQGRDCAEELKYFIKGAVENWNTKYVLLVGGRCGGVKEEKWWVPVRYSTLDDDSDFEASYLTDLYFEDLYNASGAFQTWDTDNNGVFAQWDNQSKDILDMYPDVFVGRLPCTSVAEVKTMVEKITTYENTAAGSDWFNRFIGVAGDTYPVEGDPVFEGEVATNYSFNCLKPFGFTANFIWTSLGTFVDKKDVIAAMNEGAGFVHFSGHGNPAVWSTHMPYNDSFVDGPKVWDMRKLRNGEKLPVVIVGGCHNAQFNTSLANIMSGVLKDGLKYFKSTRPFGEFWYNEWVPRCWAWGMAVQKQGGCIGIIANSGLGYGQQGITTWNHSGRYLEWLFFKSYTDGHKMLGETHAYDLLYYMYDWAPMADPVDCKIVQEWALLGDPSLMIGGYAS
jgi:hypothetical protein